MSAARILAVAGSLRAGSYNRKLLALLVEQARAQGAEVDVVDLKALALPVYDGDIEAQGLPPDGVVGEKTAAALNEELAKKSGV